ncbi:serine threonine kinase [Fusarium acutatum]|uniref:Serine threonine kinase n=1 Tax=Fusarium acutatum TaxID=78861 RepID=A0A8H4NC96_9HYPO|nr:serine threonine kinase [Fusarium acutatum]
MIQSHDNIISLLGTCRQQTDAQQDVILPVFMYEASELGDLSIWLLENKDVTLGVQIDPCLGVARVYRRSWVQGISLLDFKRSGALALNTGNFLEQFGLVSGPEEDTTDFADFRRCLLRACLLVSGALDGDLRYKTGSIAQVVDALESLGADAKEHGLRDYKNPSLDIMTRRADSMKLFVNLGTLEIQQLRMSQLKMLCRPILASEGHSDPTAQFDSRKDADDVVEIHSNSGTFALFPPAVCRHILKHLRDTYSSPHQPKLRRSRAAFEHAVASTSIPFDIAQYPDDRNGAMIAEALDISFDTEDMAYMARRLVAAGADLEAWSWGSSDLSRGGTGLDSQYGHANGTPLFWAVQANCRGAVEILLNLCAKVFPPHGLRALLAWNNGGFRPKAADWMKSLSLACVNDDRSTFDELRAIDVVADERFTWSTILGEAALRTGETYYISAIITKYQHLDQDPADYSGPFNA